MREYIKKDSLYLHLSFPSIKHYLGYNSKNNAYTCANSVSCRYWYVFWWFYLLLFSNRHTAYLIRLASVNMTVANLFLMKINKPMNKINIMYLNVTLGFLLLN